MRKIFNKIICFATAAVAAVGVMSATACSGYFGSKPLEYTPSSAEAVSNGGFAVEKGDYIYFINGKEGYIADNTFGKVVKGAIMRISKNDFSARNYSSVETVVPTITYSGNNNAGIFVYGDYVYYSTPSTEKNSDGVIQTSDLVFKSTKLDGTETMKGYYAITSSNSMEYRYVVDNNTVYLLYVATGEKLFGEDSGVTNIHSVNTATKEDTLLAYNVDAVMFDKADLSNPQIYYTMKVRDFEINKTYSTYNQVYTVRASAERKYDTGARDYTEYFTKAFADEEDGYDPETDPKYVNCGTLVLDGIGGIGKDNIFATVFNGEGADSVTRSAYTYTLLDYQHGNLFYTRKASGTTNVTTYLFNTKESELLSSSWKPVASNPEDNKCLSDTYATTSNFTYLFDGDKLEGMLISDAAGFIKTVITDDGKIAQDEGIDNVDSYYIMQDGQPTVLYVDYENSYIYYSLAQNKNGYAANGYTVNRIKFDGTADKYNQTIWPEDMDDYDPVCILDLDVLNGWYMPEMFGGQFLFPTQTTNMTDYDYIMVCDLRGLDNPAIDALNEKYKEVKDNIKDIDSTVYENLQSALQYAFYADNTDYINELIEAYVDIKGYSEYYFWSEESLEKYNDFVNCKGDWADYAADTVKVNGKDVAANRCDYYYSLLGVMNDADEEAYTDLLKSSYLKEYPEKDPTWFQTLKKGEKAGFIIGIIVGGLLLISAAILIPLFIIKKKQKALPAYKKQRVKVDTTDDKDIDVYNQEQ